MRQHRSSLTKRSRRCGFTLVELIVTIAIASILLGVAAPSFRQAMITNRVASLTNEFVASLQFARSEAVMRKTRVTLCKSATVGSATPTCDNSASWEDGWIVFLDGGVQGSIDGGDSVLKVGRPDSGNAVVSGGTNFSTYVSYLSTGVGSGSSASDGEFTVCIPPEQRNISISRTGRISVGKSGCSS
ncbi:GspH/FimT family pseudopilin [Thiorhodococcus minor]